MSSKGHRCRHESGLISITSGGGQPPGVPETFSNLFNLGTRRVSESYLREYRIKQSDKQTPFLSSSPPPPSREELKLAGMAWDCAPSLHPHALMYIHARLACHTPSVYETNFSPSPFPNSRVHCPFSLFCLSFLHMCVSLFCIGERVFWCFALFFWSLWMCALTSLFRLLC